MGAKLIRDVLIESPWDPVQSFDFGRVTSHRRHRRRRPTPASASAISSATGRIRIAAVRAQRRRHRGVGFDLVLEEGDEINAIVAPEAISEFAKRVRTRGIPARKVNA